MLSRTGSVGKLLLALALSLPAGMCAQTPAASATTMHAPDLIGQWQGTLHTNRDLRLILKVFKGDNGALKADFYSIDQGSTPAHATSIVRDGSSVKLVIDLIGARFEGKLNPDNNVIDGTWTQGDHDSPLQLTLPAKETAWEIPAPRPPPKKMAADAKPEIDVATIKLNNSGVDRLQGIGFNGHYLVTFNASTMDLILFAYGLQKKQVVGLPEDVDKDRYDIQATILPEGLPSHEQMSILVGKLLSERFGLTFHREKRELSAYVLTVTKGGPKFKAAEHPDSQRNFGLRPLPQGTMIPVFGETMDEFSSALQMLILDRPVVNQTGLDGRFDLSFTFTPDDSQFNGHPPNLPKGGENVEPAPSLFEAFQTQLGLKLSPEKTQVEVLVVDTIHKPSEN